MRRKTEEITPTTAAELIGCHKKTVYDWCRRAEAGEESRLKEVRRDPTGHLWIPRSEVDRLIDGSQ